MKVKRLESLMTLARGFCGSLFVMATSEPNSHMYWVDAQALTPMKLDKVSNKNLIITL